MESPDFQQRFSHAATRPFGDNAELKISAARWLEENTRPDEGATTAAANRWDEVDTDRNRKLCRCIIPAVAVRGAGLHREIGGVDVPVHDLQPRSP